MMGEYGTYLIQTVVTLVAVCALAAFVLVGARRFGFGRPSGPIALVGTLPLEARRSIHLVRVGDLVLVVGASEAGFVRLGELEASKLGPLESSLQRGELFSTVLARLTRDRSPSSTPNPAPPRDGASGAS